MVFRVGSESEKKGQKSDQYWGGPFFVGGSSNNLIGTCRGVSHGPVLVVESRNWLEDVSPKRLWTFWVTHTVHVDIHIDTGIR